MKHNRKWRGAAAFALALVLLSGCGGGQNDPHSPDAVDPPAAVDEKEPVQPQQKPAEKQQASGTQEAQAPDPAPVPEPEPEETPAEQPEPTSAPAPVPAPAPEPAPAPAPAPAEQPEENNAVPEDGAYTASVTLEGGTGRASVESPARLRCEGGKFWAVIVWSSSNYDYMKVDGQKYELMSTEGNSTFEIPVAAFDVKLDVIADTVAMSEPHEVEYTLQFDSASLKKA